jgi:energy-dependent translational throttle protein EttA
MKYTSWLDQKKTRLAIEEKSESARQRTLQRELEWVRMSPRARQAKNKARIQKYEEMASEAQTERIAQNEIQIPPPPRLGNDVVIAQDLKKSFGDKLLFEGLSFSLPRGDIVGIIGPNGAGKTTLFRMITGQEKPDAGTLRIGDTVQLAYVDQSRTLDGKKTVWEEISGGREQIMVGRKEINSRAYLSSFNFRGADQQKKVGDLSGGERNRLHLAKTLMSGANVLLLDEPTNDLDVDTLRALEEALLDFAGCVVVISHDRWFLDRIATHMLAFEGNSEVVWHEGNYQSYKEDLKRRKGIDADQPHRIAYKRLVRA